MKTYPKVGYKEVFTAHLPMYEQHYTEQYLDPMSECAGCGRDVSSTTLGCNLCIECDKEHVEGA